MQRRKFIIGTGALATGTAAAMGTGAFTSVEANRDVAVNVADDADAFLALNAEGGSNADEYVIGEDDGTIELDFTSTDAGGQGINEDATTIIRELFSIENQGTQDVIVFIDDAPEEPRIGFFGDTEELDSVDPAPDGVENDGALSNTSALDPDNLDGAGNEEAAPILGAGESIDDVGVIIQVGEDEDFDDFDETVTIRALTQEEAELEGRL